MRLQPYVGLILLGVSVAPSCFSATLLHRYTFQGDYYQGSVSDQVGSDTGAIVDADALVIGGKLTLRRCCTASYIQFASHVVPTSGSYSVTLFAQEIAPRATAEFISQGFQGGPGFYLGYTSLPNGGREIRATDSWPITGVPFPSDGLRHHYALVVDATTNQSRLYVDGMLKATSPTAIITTAGGNDTRLGRQSDCCSDENFNGTLEDVRIYSGALTDQEVITLANALGPPVHGSLVSTPTITTAGIVGPLVFTGAPISNADFMVISTDLNNYSIAAGGGIGGRFDSDGKFSLTGMNREQYTYPQSPLIGDGAYTILILPSFSSYVNCAFGAYDRVPQAAIDTLCANDVSSTGPFYRTGGVWTVGASGRTGTISVSTNLSASTFTITGPINYSGSGKSFTANNAPIGSYTITYGAVSCYGTLASQNFTLTAGGSIRFNGTYQGAATVTVNISPLAATSGTFSINPPIPRMRSTSPYPVVQHDVLPQSYTRTFNPVNGFQTPAAQTLAPSPPFCAAIFDGTYTPQGATSSTATLSIQTSKSNGVAGVGGAIVYRAGSVSVDNIVGFSNGSPAPPIQLPAPGSYDVVYNNTVAGYYAPLKQTVTLNPGDSAHLTGLYRRLILISFTGFGNAGNDMAQNHAQCVPFGITGSGIIYPSANWSTAPEGMINLLDKVKKNSELSTGADMAGFTFYSTDGKGNQLGNACSPGSDTIHTEAQNWFSAQNVFPEDVVAVVGHSYGGDRARRFVDDLKRGDQPLISLRPWIQ